MTDQQLSFVEHYVGEANRNGAEAARLAGYSHDRARHTAYDLLRDKEITDEIAVRFKAMTMTSEEAAKRLSDIASTRLNDYFKIVQVQGREQYEEYATVLLANTKREIDTIKAMIEREQLSKRDRKPLARQIQRLLELCLEYQLDIARYGDQVKRLAVGKPCIVEAVELDLVALAQANERGLVKSYQMTKFGPKVELESASAALVKILEYHGKIVTKHQLLGKDGKPAKMKVTLNLGGPALRSTTAA